MPDQAFSGCFNITPIRDGLFEQDEEFFIIIRTTDKNVFINEAMAKITIVDEDSMCLNSTCSETCVTVASHKTA